MWAVAQEQRSNGVGRGPRIEIEWQALAQEQRSNGSGP